MHIIHVDLQLAIRAKWNRDPNMEKYNFEQETIANMVFLSGDVVLCVILRTNMWLFSFFVVLFIQSTVAWNYMVHNVSVYKPNQSMWML